MTIITSKYRSDTARLFMDDIIQNDYYLFISSTENTRVLNTHFSKNEFLEKTLFGKRIDQEEIFFMVKNNPWQINTIYTQYDDREDLSGKKYYAVVYPENNETDDYKVYKCLFNNYGSQSISPPNYSITQPDQIYQLADGYIWKFLYSISVLDFEKYNAMGYIPLPQSSNNAIIEETSSIDQIFVENANENRGYETVVGTIEQVDTFTVNTGTDLAPIIETFVGNITIAAPSGAFNQIAEYYAGYSIYITNSNDVSELYTIDSYSYNNITGNAVIRLRGSVNLDPALIGESTYQIIPRIEIRGDGIGARAIPIVSETGNITTVRVLNRGSGYTNATAVIPDPFGFDPSSLNSLDERVTLRPILSPIGGHGSNLADELGSKSILLYVTFNEFDNEIIPASNSFASVGIVKNPTFKSLTPPPVFDNRIQLELEEHSLSINETITQIETDPAESIFNELRFSGKVHEIVNNNIFVSEYMGPYPNTQTAVSNTEISSDVSLKIDLPLFSSQNQILIINTNNENYAGFTLSPYVQRTGEVYYMNRFFPITRTEDSREQFKIIFEF